MKNKNLDVTNYYNLWCNHATFDFGTGEDESVMTVDQRTWRRRRRVGHEWLHTMWRGPKCSVGVSSRRDAPNTNTLGLDRAQVTKHVLSYEINVKFEDPALQGYPKSGITGLFTNLTSNCSKQTCYVTNQSSLVKFQNIKKLRFFHVAIKSSVQ